MLLDTRQRVILSGESIFLRFEDSVKKDASGIEEWRAVGNQKGYGVVGSHFEEVVMTKVRLAIFVNREEEIKRTRLHF